MNLIIPTFLLIAMIVISYKMYKEYKEKQRLNGLINYFETKEVVLTDEQVGKIEASAKNIKHYKRFWDNFDTAKYIEILEVKYSSGQLK